MNQDLLRLKQLRDKIIGIEMQLSLTEADLIAIERDIEYLENLLEMLDENIAVLKTNGIIAIASEYKKARQEQKTVQANLSLYQDLLVKLTREFDYYKKMHQTSLEEFEILNKNIDSVRVVLILDPAKRKK